MGALRCELRRNLWVLAFAWTGALVLGCNPAVRGDDRSDTIWGVNALTKVLPETVPPPCASRFKWKAQKEKPSAGRWWYDAPPQPGRSAPNPRHCAARAARFRRAGSGSSGSVHRRAAQLGGRAGGRTRGEGTLRLARPVLGRC